ncbi:MAG: N-acetylmuramoyl-L-alanine amidase [Candidatus Omnitrophica bacterium]|nr:N-acetylmuramoyl-L-alanine amidase [Candidatus Omnitrophota bacterium]
MNKITKLSTIFTAYKNILLCIFLLVFLSSCATPSRVPRKAKQSGYAPGVSLYQNVLPTQPGYIQKDLPIKPSQRYDILHTVAPGETIWRISKMYDVSIDELVRINKIKDVTDVDIGTKLKVPSAVKRKDVITLYPSNKWKYIIIHHSATDLGSSEMFNVGHLKKGWEGVGYHFVIDNGTCGKECGQIETTPRWLEQRNGAHCKADNMNERGIGICLVGNYSEDAVPEKQLQSLAYLVNQLKKYYKIPNSNILGHGQVKDAQTECPGTKFPWRNLKTKIN